MVWGSRAPPLRGGPPPDFTDTGPAASFGDLQIAARFAPLDDERTLGLGLSAFVSLPTGSTGLLLSAGVPTLDGWEDEDGCPDPDVDGTPLLRIEGHVGSVAPDLCQALSERRAVAVMRWLAENGVDFSRLEAVGRGCSAPSPELPEDRIEFHLVRP